MKSNQEIRELLKKYEIKYYDLLQFIPNFSHTTRISEELATPLSNERKKVYLDAIEKVIQKKQKELEKYIKGEGR